MRLYEDNVDGAGNNARRCDEEIILSLLGHDYNASSPSQESELAIKTLVHE